MALRVPDSAESLVDVVENGVEDDEEIGGIVSVHRIGCSRVRWPVKVIAAIMRVLVAVPATHPRAVLPGFPVRDEERTVGVSSELECCHLESVGEVLVVECGDDGFGFLPREHGDSFDVRESTETLCDRTQEWFIEDAVGWLVRH
ncbi:hypothetical protein [Halocalculus aciditolerans]|uniref:hypothetical protein n=1 Tax=Halocalculus aciditolerans TaxID=1383812 RepID=UPI00166393FE|nr:hypothetical protein [Halocalculus aciditolerans]